MALAAVMAVAMGRDMALAAVMADADGEDRAWTAEGVPCIVAVLPAIGRTTNHKPRDRGRDTIVFCHLSISGDYGAERWRSFMRR